MTGVLIGGNVDTQRSYQTLYTPRADLEHREEASICNPRREASEGAKPVHTCPELRETTSFEA